MKVKKGLFGTKYMYLDENTRVRYGFKFIHLGVVYTLQRKSFLVWIEKAWTYPSTHTGRDIESIIDYLKWYEGGNDGKCKF